MQNFVAFSEYMNFEIKLVQMYDGHSEYEVCTSSSTSLWHKIKIFFLKTITFLAGNFDLSEQGYEPQIFNNFPAHDLNFHEK